MKSRYINWVATLFCTFLALQSQAQVLISELESHNTRGIVDQDAEYSDWVELYNAGTNSVELVGWYLTDDPTDLKRWKFPQTTLEAGKFLVVFASNKDRRTPGAELHTNFKLGNDGEYLALVQPDGVTVSSEYKPGFPVLPPDISYGFGIERTTSALLPAGSNGRWMSPTGVGIDPRWTDPSFNDSGWSNGVSGFGFSRGDDVVANGFSQTMTGLKPVAWWSFSEPAGTTNAANSGSATNITGFYRNGAILGSAGMQNPAVPGFDSTNTSVRLDGVNDYVGTDSSFLNNRTAFTLSGWVNPSATNSPRIGFFGQHDVAEVGFTDGSYVGFVTAEGGSIKAYYPFKANEWHHVAAVATGSEIRLYLDGLQVAEGGNAVRDYGASLFPFNIGGGGIFDNAGNAFKGFMDEVAIFDRALTSDEIYAQVQSARNPTNAYSTQIATDLGDSLLNKSSSLLIRMPFTVTDAAVDQLILKMRYDDGFVAYINGIEVASKNAPDQPFEGSVATDARLAGAGLVPEDFDISNLAGVIHPGTNVLAVLGLNSSASDADFLIAPELWASKTRLDTNALRFFVIPTPGAANGFGSTNLGPLIREVKHTPNVPKEDDDVTVTARVTPTFDPVSSVVLTYRFMYAGETNITMLDDGQHGDGAAGDGIYGATIPAGTNTVAGQMIRYFISASDTTGDTNRWPPYIDKLNSPQYLGTVVFNPVLTNPLPVLHMFVQNTNAPNSSGGTRCSIFYHDEFFDNVFINIHGQSTSGGDFPKKSYNLNFNTGYHIRPATNMAPVKGFNLLTVYADKSHMRSVLAYGVYKDAGADYHVAFNVRVEQNGKFFSDAHWVEDGDADFLERLGLDRRGSLYKMYNTFDAATGEKKTRRTEGFQDLTDLFNGTRLTGTNRTAFLWDNVDIPAFVNSLAAMIITGNVDCCHKNYYFYHDLEGTGEWRMMPWDVDLSFGRVWNSTDTYFDDNMHPDTGLNVGSNNSLMGALFGIPAFNAMYNRRIRTLMDEQVQAPGVPYEELKFEKKIDDLYNLVAPDAALDFAKWPTYRSKQTLTQAVSILKTNYLVNRRKYMYNTLSGSATKTIPLAQPTNAVIRIANLDYNPASGNQAEEWIQLRNTNNYSVDISNWKLTGAIQHTFHPGTIIPTNGVLYVSPDVRAFRGRRLPPKGNQGLFVQGNYKGQLSAWGEGISLINTASNIVDTYSYAPAPSLAQQSLRITSIMFHPQSRVGQTNTEDFEYIKLQNIGTERLNLNGVRFSRGLDFAFTGSSVTNLDPGQVVFVVRNRPAFELRYGASANVAGEYLGSLDSNGETLRLDDANGEKILEFAYNNTWFPSTDGSGAELAVLNKNILWSNWGEKTNWVANATPIFTETTALAGWKSQHFSLSEIAEAKITGDTDDPDGDGLSNASEFIAGTDPRDAGSFLKVELAREIGKGFTLRFPAAQGKSYSIMYRDSLAIGSWKKLVDVMEGASRVVTQTDASATGPRRFYRLNTPRAP